MKVLIKASASAAQGQAQAAIPQTDGP
jgi:hypothetical protein